MSAFWNFVREKNNIKKILLIRNGLLGDITFVTSVLNRLSDNYPGARTDIITGPRAKELLHGFPGIGKIIPFDYDYSIFSIIRQIFFFLNFRKQKYDLILVQENNTHFTLMSFLAGGKFRIGFKNSLSFLYDYAIERPKRNAVLAEMATVEAWTKAFRPDKAYLYTAETEDASIKKRLTDAGIDLTRRIMIIHPGSNSDNSDRQWVTHSYSTLADNLIEKFDAQIIFTGVRQDSSNISLIMNGMKFKALDLAGKTSVRELMSLIKQASLVIGPDTGSLHMACAFDIPVIMLMGLADPLDTGAFNPNGKALIARAELDCSPCVHKNPKPAQWEECKNMRPVKCMKELSVEAVMEKLDMLLD